VLRQFKNNDNLTEQPWDELGDHQIG